MAFDKIQRAATRLTGAEPLANADEATLDANDQAAVQIETSNANTIEQQAAQSASIDESNALKAQGQVEGLVGNVKNFFDREAAVKRYQQNLQKQAGHQKLNQLDIASQQDAMTATHEMSAAADNAGITQAYNPSMAKMTARDHMAQKMLDPENYALFKLRNDSRMQALSDNKNHSIAINSANANFITTNARANASVETLKNFNALSPQQKETWGKNFHNIYDQLLTQEKTAPTKQLKTQLQEARNQLALKAKFAGQYGQISASMDKVGSELQNEEQIGTHVIAIKQAKTDALNNQYDGGSFPQGISTASSENALNYITGVHQAYADALHSGKYPNFATAINSYQNNPALKGGDPRRDMAMHTLSLIKGGQGQQVVLNAEPVSGNLHNLLKMKLQLAQQLPQASTPEQQDKLSLDMQTNNLNIEKATYSGLRHLGFTPNVLGVREPIKQTLQAMQSVPGTFTYNKPGGTLEDWGRYAPDHIDTLRQQLHTGFNDGLPIGGNNQQSIALHYFQMMAGTDHGVTDHDLASDALQAGSPQVQAGLAKRSTTLLAGVPYHSQASLAEGIQAGKIGDISQGMVANLSHLMNMPAPKVSKYLSFLILNHEYQTTENQTGGTSADIDYKTQFSNATSYVTNSIQNMINTRLDQSTSTTTGYNYYHRPDQQISNGFGTEHDDQWFADQVGQAMHNKQMTLVTKNLASGPNVDEKKNVINQIVGKPENTSIYHSGDNWYYHVAGRAPQVVPLSVLNSIQKQAVLHKKDEGKNSQEEQRIDAEIGPSGFQWR